MELILQILMLFILLNCMLKLSFWRWWQAVIFGLVGAAFVVFMCDYAILQSKTQIADYLRNKTVLQNMAVVITLESAICFLYCIFALRGLFGKEIKRDNNSWGGNLLHWYSGLLIFPVLFYALTQTIFAMPGYGFTTISWFLATAVLVILPLMAWLLRYLFPEAELRLEVHFLVSLFVCILGLLTTVSGEVTYAATSQPANRLALLLAFSLFALLFMLGFVWNQVKWCIKAYFSNKKNKHTE
jgi:hypothetical protein